MGKAIILGGSAGYEQSRKIAEYENKKANISFSVGDGEDAEAQTVKALGMAMTYVLRALGNPVVIPDLLGQTPPAPVAPVADPGTLTDAQVAAVAAKTTTRRPPKAKTEPAPATPPATDPAAIGGEAAPQIRTNPENRVDPAQVTDDPASLFTAEAPAAAVTDKALSDAVTRKNAALVQVHGEKASPMIRKLIGTYVQAGQQMYQIPAGSRAKFLEELEALK